MGKHLKYIIVLCFLVTLFLRGDAYSKRVFGIQTAEDLPADTGNFDGNLSVADDTVQKALDTLDDVVAAGAVDISDDTNLAGTANEIVLTDDTLSIHADIARDTEIAALQADDLVTLSGVAIGSTHLSTFTGATISDNQTIKSALQELETAVEGVAGGHDPVTLDTGSHDYLSLAAQEITLGEIDIGDDTNLAGTANEIVLTGDVLSLHADIARDSEIG